jgi:ADP-ribosyl-[dinitrogen reductase] hydrolase
MALCLADALLAYPHQQDVHLEDLNKRFVRWYRKGENSVTGVCFDIGITTRRSLEHFEETGEVYSPLTGDHFAGNGSIMRLAPVAVRWHAHEGHAIQAARQQSQTTHGALQAVEGCALLAHILFRAINGDSKTQIFENLTFQTKSEKINTLVTEKPWRHKSRDDIVSSGYVYHTLEAALWCVYRTDNFKDAVLLAANLGDDADTVAAVTGQIAGALYGISGIPPAWREKLAWYDILCQKAYDLFQLGLGAKEA